jgi:hypothetical protein
VSVKRRAPVADHREVVGDPNVPVDEATCWNCGGARRPQPWCPQCLERYERTPEPEFEYVRVVWRKERVS